MIVELTDSVSYGDKPSPVEGIGKFGAVINVAHRLRQPYWSDLGRLPWETWYFRLALPDRNVATDQYCDSLAKVLDAIRQGGKLPILCHCRLGGHRGPSSALFAVWHLSGRNRNVFTETYDKLSKVGRGFTYDTLTKVGDGVEFGHAQQMYRRSIIDYCLRNSV